MIDQKITAPCGRTPRTCCVSPARLSKLLVVLAFLALLSGCATPQFGLIDDERHSIAAGHETLVILRTVCIIDGQPEECFGGFAFNSDGPIVAFGIGSFDTLGEPRPAGIRFLSDASRRAGWGFFLLPPGIHYLEAVGPISGAFFQPPHSRQAQRWRIDVSGQAPLQYAGTIHLFGRSAGTRMFGGVVIEADRQTAPVMKDESELARALLAESTHERLVSRLMTRWHEGAPIVIRTPAQRPVK